jgi:hypothetical protein
MCRICLLVRDNQRNCNWFQVFALQSFTGVSITDWAREVKQAPRRAAVSDRGLSSPHSPSGWIVCSKDVAASVNMLPCRSVSYNELLVDVFL